MSHYMYRRVTSPKRVTSPTWGPPPPCKQALRVLPLQLLTTSTHRVISFLEGMNWPHVRFLNVEYIHDSLPFVGC